MARCVGSLVGLILLVGSVSALPRTADDAFAAGLAAARAGAFDDAAEHFATARRAGMTAPALTFNIGVVSYRLSRFDDAAAAFRVPTADADWSALAYYHLGLTEQRWGNAETAAGHFREAQARADSPKLIALAGDRLQQLGARASGPPPASPRWHGIASMAAGYDDNVLLADEQIIDAASDEADAFGEVPVAARRPVGTPDSGLHVDLSAYYRAHADLDDFDFGALSVALSWRRPMGDWLFTTGRA